MALDAVVSRSFVVVRADRTAAEARTELEDAADWLIVERPADDGTHWYLFLMDQARALLAQAPDASLTDALGLHEWSAAQTLDADADASAATAGAIVLRAGRPIGFIDPRGPTAALRPEPVGAEPPPEPPPAPPRVRRGGQRAKPPAPTGPAADTGGPGAAPEAAEQQRSVEAAFPGTVKADAIEWLLVTIVNQAPTASGLGIDVAAGESVDILVQPRRGFEVVGESHGTLEVPATGESLPLQFKLRAVDVGKGLVRVLVFSKGEPLGVITLEPTVEPAAAAVRGHTTSAPAELSAQALAAASPRIPDLSMFIEERETGGKLEFTIRLSASDPGLDLNLRPFGPFTLQVDPSAFFESFFQEIEDLPGDTPAQRAVADRRLAAKGAYLTETLMPADLRDTLWQLRDKLTSIIVQSEEPWIPWELCRLVGRDADGRTVEGPFLCEAFAITRWLPGLGFKRPLRIDNLALVVPGDSGLPLATAERDYVLSLAAPGRTVTSIDPTFTTVQDAFVAGSYDAWHFTGHGASKAANPDASAIMLAGDESFTPEDVSGQAANVGLSHPLVFINACQVGRGGMALTGIGGWARRFVQVGAGAFIGAYWSVYDEAAFAFAKEVYAKLLDSMPIGEAVRAARIAVRTDGDPTWLAYTVFADPLASVEPAST
ncbi:MAG: CHAT domain-containing protein [Chloroflexota bacterium]